MIELLTSLMSAIKYATWSNVSQLARQGYHITYVSSAIRHLLVDIVITENLVHCPLSSTVIGSFSALAYLSSRHQEYCDVYISPGRDLVGPSSRTAGSLLAY